MSEPITVLSAEASRNGPSSRLSLKLMAAAVSVDPGVEQWRYRSSTASTSRSVHARISKSHLKVTSDRAAEVSGMQPSLDGHGSLLCSSHDQRWPSVIGAGSSALLPHLIRFT